MLMSEGACRQPSMAQHQDAHPLFDSPGRIVAQLPKETMLSVVEEGAQGR